ncbi:GntR family transcriptional regulator [Agaricicola taiwanensis]|uniref:GntR family transcriptional regulator n=1 Tax=Agaricicola taiwanensis TaxID=591372 RepID=A0A8J3E1E7_9RHOB|nr:GntR family transcriptional regulator [Agaricicola taiwanensis]GGE53778.1 GntR family transcriptional regulator [Agaricicola taiwanensis]
MRAEKMDAGVDGERQSSRGLSAQAYETILDMIMSKELRPGDIIQERRLAERVGISRTPLREALHRLEGERVLERRGEAKLTVREITIQDLMEALHIRRLLESEAAARATGHIPAEVLDDLAHRLHALRDGGDPTVPDHHQIDDDLHGTIAEASGNRLMGEIIADLRRKTRMFSMKRMPERFPAICQEHLEIVEALKGGDPDRAAKAATQHLDNVKQSILSKLADF